MYVGVASTVAPYADAGKLRALATAGAKRSSTMPGVSTVTELGYPRRRTGTPSSRPAKTPRELDFWSRELTKALNDPQVRVELAKLGLESAPVGREEVAEYFDRRA